MSPIKRIRRRLAQSSLRAKSASAAKGRQENGQHIGNDLRDPEERAARQPGADRGDLSSQAVGSPTEARTWEPAWLSVGQLCRRWQLDRKTVYKFIDAKILPTWKVSSHLYRIAMTDVLRFESQNRVQPATDLSSERSSSPSPEKRRRRTG